MIPIGQTIPDSKSTHQARKLTPTHPSPVEGEGEKEGAPHESYGRAENTKKRVMLSWSTGKDSAWTLHTLLQDPEIEVVGLLSTVNTTHDRVAMHSTRRRILEAQAVAVGLQLTIIPLPWPCPNSIYEQASAKAVENAVVAGVTHMAFGDLFLQDIRAYREKMLAPTPITPLFPIWGIPTGELALRMIEGGVEAYVTCVDPKQLDRSFAGRRFDRSFLEDLPAEADPCGERGEFHTCVAYAPGFRNRLDVRVGEVVEREGFVFADLVVADDHV